MSGPDEQLVEAIAAAIWGALTDAGWEWEDHSPRASDVSGMTEAAQAALSVMQDRMRFSMSRTINSFICGTHGVTRFSERCRLEKSGECSSPFDSPKIRRFVEEALTPPSNPSSDRP